MKNSANDDYGEGPLFDLQVEPTVLRGDIVWEYTIEYKGNAAYLIQRLGPDQEVVEDGNVFVWRLYGVEKNGTLEPLLTSTSVQKLIELAGQMLGIDIDILQDIDFVSQYEGYDDDAEEELDFTLCTCVEALVDWRQTECKFSIAIRIPGDQRLAGVKGKAPTYIWSGSLTKAKGLIVQWCKLHGFHLFGNRIKVRTDAIREAGLSEEAWEVVRLSMEKHLPF